MFGYQHELADQQWRLSAACRGLGGANNPFFSDHPLEIQYALDLCAKCTVGADCRKAAYAMQEQFGIWDGEQEKVRRRKFDRRKRSDTLAESQGTPADC